jgi:hypothetical protein
MLRQAAVDGCSWLHGADRPAGLLEAGPVRCAPIASDFSPSVILTTLWRRAHRMLRQAAFSFSNPTFAV